MHTYHQPVDYHFFSVKVLTNFFLSHLVLNLSHKNYLILIFISLLLTMSSYAPEESFLYYEINMNVYYLINLRIYITYDI